METTQNLLLSVCPSRDLVHSSNPSREFSGHPFLKRGWKHGIFSHFLPPVQICSFTRDISSSLGCPVGFRLANPVLQGLLLNFRPENECILSLIWSSWDFSSSLQHFLSLYSSNLPETWRDVKGKRWGCFPSLFFSTSFFMLITSGWEYFDFMTNSFV